MQRLICGGQVASCKLDLRQSEIPLYEQIGLLPALRDAQRLLQGARCLFQSIPGVEGVRQE